MEDVIPSIDDNRDLIAGSYGTTIPSMVDLIPDVEEVEDQLRTNSCTANAAAIALEIAYKRAGIKIDFSRMYIYWFIRKLGEINGDRGGYPRDIGKALSKYGICEEHEWEFINENLTAEPPALLIEKAAEHKVCEYSRVRAWTKSGLAENIKEHLANGIPVLATMKDSNEFRSLLHGKTWREHEWFPYVRKGAHQVVFIGYDDSVQRFLAANSWGPSWGDGGFFGVPYHMVTSSDPEFFEFWILNKIKVNYVPTY